MYINPSSQPKLYQWTEMNNFNYFNSLIPDNIKNLVYLQILQDNMSLRKKLSDRSFVNMESDLYKINQNSNDINIKTKIQDSQPRGFQENKSQIVSNIARKIKKQPIKNQTKNIPKNFGKAIVTFIEHNKQLTRRILSHFPEISFSDFMYFVKNKKKQINSISDLRQLWTQTEDNMFIKPIRILSNYFIRKFSLEYIFDSRISNFSGHIKYRTRLLDALKRPDKFTNIKHF